MVSGVIMILVF